MDTDLVKQRLLEYFAHSEVEVKDTAGTGDYLDIRIVSSLFKGKSKVEQHQLVYKALGTWVGNEIHAVTIDTLTPA